jgi:RNA polymerase sigma-70 factor (ECF subfamily)
MAPRTAFGRTASGQSLDEAVALVSALREGDPDALGKVYLEYRKAVRSTLCRMVADRSVADDLTQETFLLLPQAIQTFREGCSLKTFVVSIAMNLGRHHIRTTLRRRRVLSGYAELPELRLAESPEQLLARRQLGSTIVQALSRLSPDKQQTFMLREYHEYSSLETAQMTRAPEATVRTRVHHARRMLREALGHRGYENAA